MSKFYWDKQKSKFVATPPFEKKASKRSTIFDPIPYERRKNAARAEVRDRRRSYVYWHKERCGIQRDVLAYFLAGLEWHSARRAKFFSALKKIKQEGITAHDLAHVGSDVMGSARRPQDMARALVDSGHSLV